MSRYARVRSPTTCADTSQADTGQSGAGDGAAVPASVRSGTAEYANWEARCRWKMSSAGYLYDLPPVVVSDFCRVMDTLSHSDWTRFASRVALDQTELRQIQNCEGRTDRLMNSWGNRNGTVSELLRVLEELSLFRARDIVLNWKPNAQPDRNPKPSSLMPTCLSSLFTDPTKEVTKPPTVPETKPLPEPEPPPLGMESKERVMSTVEECLSQPQSLLSMDSPSIRAMCWSFEEIQRGTENFSEARRIGEGGFGLVYRATMRNTDFAVKKLKEDSQLDWTILKQSFKTEVENLSIYRHPNIMDFVGYSIGGGTHCLLYVLMPNGSLEDRLHCPARTALSWQQRISILKGSAKGIQFLHSCSPKVIHGDVKSSNILLGEHLEPKLSDFGLARLCQTPSRATGKTTTVAQTMTVRGTLAYLPDEYLKDGQLGVVTDVFSFGVVMLEVLTGRKALEMSSASKAVYLKDLVSEIGDEQTESNAKETREQTLDKAAKHICKKHLDPKLGLSVPVPVGPVEISKLACMCLDRRRKRRPQMTEVFKQLEEVSSSQKTSCCIHATVNVSSDLPDPSPPKTLFSSDEMGSLGREFSKLGPQEDTYYCLQIPQISSLRSSASQSSELPKSEKIVGTWDTPVSSRIPCESDESQGYSQYSFHSGSGGNSETQWSRNENAGSYGSTAAASLQPTSAGIPSQKVVVNPVKQRLVQKIKLYEAGFIASSDLLSSGGSMSNPSQEPVESDELAGSPLQTKST
ncbi:interleukin-1 receptor-associated kinase 1 [Denticeps clupeoides]|uniref:Interleukin-1 receptor-associated kinase 1 n=1 Tax=Denticeps clupeoides TaxID=299321 RepID=A0A8C4A1T7_9TELE|nr:interleukin-1 receptor-associated kinase 1-like [Denticeps clupeoides]XP_028848954.1 interleukin-1 receptor-associated kinase 1-like [Denticeps clupeoides]